MAGYELSETAERRLAEIYEHSILRFGSRTARRYLNSLDRAFQLLAENPQMGSQAVAIRRGFRRLVHESHVIYYRPTETGVLIVEVLHRAQDPGRHL